MICDKIKNGKLTTMIYGILMLKITQLTVQSMRIQVNKSIQGKFDEYALTDSGLGLGKVYNKMLGRYITLTQNLLEHIRQIYPV